MSNKRLTPKRPPVETAGLADLFPYYAGFSFEWACERIADVLGDSGSKVLDPWNGGGTTTTAARHVGCAAIGIDRNPVANIIAKLRSQPPFSLKTLQEPTVSSDGVDVEIDPLDSWFGRETRVRLRQWATSAKNTDSASQTSLILTAIFRAVRSLTKGFEGSNPTWVRHAGTGDLIVDVSGAELDELIVSHQDTIVARINSFMSPVSSVAIVTASAQQLPLPAASIDYILTSPPYLTRIDYAVAYARELAVLGHDIRGSARSLRADLMGTTLIRNRDVNGASLDVGYLAESLVKEISTHRSKDSSGYYRKQIVQYFLDLTSTLDEVTRVSSSSATMQLVVQDSYYKDIPVSLAEIYREEACRRGWVLDSAEQFDVIRSLTSLNTSARAYSKSRVSETMLTLRRSA